MRRLDPFVALFVALAVVPACDSKSAPAAAPAKEEATPSKDEALEKRKKEREQKAADEAKKAEAEKAALDTLATIPTDAKKPKKLEQACKQMLDAYDGFMRKVLKGDMLTKWTTGGNEMQLAVFRKECLKGNIDVALCQANALGKAGPEMEPKLAALMGRCAEKFGGGEAKASPPPVR